jgi:hypothetical protein
MSLGSSCSVVDKINYYCVPGLQLDGVKQYINSEVFRWDCSNYKFYVSVNGLDSLVNLLIFSDYPFIYFCQFSFSSIINIFRDIIHSYAQEYNNAVVSAQFLKPFTNDDF